MSLSTATYYFLLCNGKVDNLLNPRCQIMGPGSFDDAEAVAKAVEQGWVQPGKNAYCPAHADQAPADPTATAATGTPDKRRTRKSAQDAASSATPEFS